MIKRESRPFGWFALKVYSAFSTREQRIEILSVAKPFTKSHYYLTNVGFLTEEKVYVNSALQYQYFDKNKDVFTTSLLPTDQEEMHISTIKYLKVAHQSCEVFTTSLLPTDQVQRKCTYQIPSRSSKL
jgi:hypothetical protein